jgi:glutaredoxin-related protein
MNKLKKIVSIACLLFALQSFAQEVEKTNDRKQEKKLIFFSNDGCGKCSTSQKFFDTHHMPYEKLSIKENRPLMYEYIHKKTNGKHQGVGYPVLIYGDSIYFSIKNLNIVLGEIKQMMEMDGVVEKSE